MFLRPPYGFLHRPHPPSDAHRDDMYGQILRWQNKSVPKHIKEEEFPPELKMAVHGIFPDEDNNGHKHGHKHEEDQ